MLRKHLRRRPGSSKFGSGGAFRWRKQRVEGLEIYRIGDVDDGFASEFVGILPENCLQSRIVDGQDHDVARDQDPGAGCRRPRLARLLTTLIT
jgi:hypothetical protein